jgi:serine/threonine protein phosphatase PrpC/protein-S-isoprenylcysteine O-methyltransferase Ste14
VRTENQDAFLVGDMESGVRINTPALSVTVPNRGMVAVLSDGMGGHAAGETASALTVESLLTFLSDPGADRSSYLTFINTAVRLANADVTQAANAGDKRGMGATLTAVIFRDFEAYFAEVGDSRAYLLRAGRLRQITKDQSYVQLLVDAGALTPEQAAESPRKNLILQAMGRDENIQPAVSRLGLCRNDRLLLSCDGLSNVITDAEIESILCDDDLSKVCDRLIDTANERGGFDNLTAVVVLVEGDELPLPDTSKDAPVEVLQEYEGPSSTRKFSSIPPPASKIRHSSPAATALHSDTVKKTADRDLQISATGAILRLASFWLILPLFFLITGGSIAWWNAWIYCALLLGPMSFFFIYMIKRDPEFIARRLKFREKERPQRRVIAFGFPLLLASLIIPGLDLRFGWSPVPTLFSASAMISVFLGYLLILRVFLENRWAGRTVETWSEQPVISTGPYAIVRHPMYAGFIVFYIATPAALGSWWGVLPALAFFPILVFRIRNEEEVLIRELKGYEEYRRKVPFRLVPFVW